MSYTARKVGELTAGGASRAPCVYYDETITFSDNVAADEWIFLVLAYIGGGAIPGFPCIHLSNPNINGYIPPFDDHCNGPTPIPNASADCFGGISTNAERGPNPMISMTQPLSLTGPITIGDTATISQDVVVGGTSVFPPYQAMICAIKTVPALTTLYGFPIGSGSVDGCPDLCVGGVDGIDGADPDGTSTTQTVTAYYGQNPSAIFGTCGRQNDKQLLLAAFAAYTLTPPSYTAGWTEEASSNDGVGCRISLAVKELSTTGDGGDYPVVATWGSAQRGSAALLQLAEDTPPDIHLAHRLGFGG